MKTAIVIPARYGSSRFPGKPLAAVAGRSMLSRVWRIAKAVPQAETVLIATDDSRIADHAKAFGAQVVMTEARCENGSERVRQALAAANYSPELIINLQGDALLTPPSIISELIAAMQEEQHCSIGTLACSIAAETAHGSTLVVFDNKQRALYFSRALIPHFRDGGGADQKIYKHIGIYAYRPRALEQYVSLPPSRLERAEQLEQLRALENGMDIRVVVVETAGRTLTSIDRPEDVARVEAIIGCEGELLP